MRRVERGDLVPAGVADARALEAARENGALAQCTATTNDNTKNGLQSPVESAGLNREEHAQDNATNVKPAQDNANNDDVKPGAELLLSGLRERAEINGSRVKVLEYHADVQRWAVGPAHGTKIRVKVANLTALQ